MKHKPMSLKSKSYSYLLVLLLIMTAFLLVGCDRLRNHYLKWNHETNRLEMVDSAKRLQSEQPVAPKEVVISPKVEKPVASKEVVIVPKVEKPVAPEKTVVTSETQAVTEKSVPVSGKPKAIKPNHEEEIQNLVNKWLTSWQSGDIKTYRSCYDEADFESRGNNLDAWISYKTNVRKKSKNIKISIDKLQISANNNIATAVFIQHYRSSILKDSGKKTLKLRKSNNEWKIYKEIM